MLFSISSSPNNVVYGLTVPVATESISGSSCMTSSFRSSFELFGDGLFEKDLCGRSFGFIFIGLYSTGVFSPCFMFLAIVVRVFSLFLPVFSFLVDFFAFLSLFCLKLP